MDPSGNTIVLRIIIIVILLALSAYFFPLRKQHLPW